MLIPDRTCFSLESRVRPAILAADNSGDAELETKPPANSTKSGYPTAAAKISNSVYLTLKPEWIIVVISTVNIGVLLLFDKTALVVL